MIRKVFIADCDYCHQHFCSSEGLTVPRMFRDTEGTRTALRIEGWWCGEGTAPQVLCPNCKWLKESDDGK